MPAKIALFFQFLFWGSLPLLYAQEQPSIPIQVRASEQIILAVADAQPAIPSGSIELADALKTFNQVLREDLRFSGYFTLAARSFYPPKPIVNPEEDIDFEAWSSLPFQVSFLTVGTLNVINGVLRADLSVWDMKQHVRVLGKRITGDVDQTRTAAHRWADEVVYQLTAGASKGIASTKIAYVSRSGKVKEIYIMDYDGHNPHAFTHNRSLSTFPNWSPDNSKLAFATTRTGSWEISIHSYIDGSRVPFPIFNSHASTPAISPDGASIAFSLRTPRGDTDIFVSRLDANGSGRRDITNNPAIDYSPTWSPSGQQLAFVSDRYGGVSQIYICDADGSNIRRIIKEGGDADVPAWSPDGRWLAFHWKPYMSTNYDLYIADVVTGDIRQLTSGNGSDECPSWSPDGRHLVFQSNRSGRNQIYIMLLDGTEVRQLTTEGKNTSPAWSGYFNRE